MRRRREIIAILTFQLAEQWIQKFRHNYVPSFSRIYPAIHPHIYPVIIKEIFTQGLLCASTNYITEWRKIPCYPSQTDWKFNWQKHTVEKKNLKKEICSKAILFGSVVFCMSSEQEHGQLLPQTVCKDVCVANNLGRRRKYFRLKQREDLFAAWWLRQSRICLQFERPGFDLWVGKIPGEWNGTSRQYSCLENSMDRGIHWRATVHGVVQSWT